MASPESPLAIKRNKELTRAGEVVREVMRGERNMIGVSKYLLVSVLVVFSVNSKD
jgi:hypothetical protein